MIHEKFQSLGLSRCKVFVSNVDVQESLDGGILIQSLGEISNMDEPSRKFVQTFFLAEQDKGEYFVLNDIFRYIREDFEESSDTESAVVDPSPMMEPPPERTESLQAEPAFVERGPVSNGSMESVPPVPTPVKPATTASERHNHEFSSTPPEAEQQNKSVAPAPETESTPLSNSQQKPSQPQVKAGSWASMVAVKQDDARVSKSRASPSVQDRVVPSKDTTANTTPVEKLQSQPQQSQQQPQQQHHYHQYQQEDSVFVRNIHASLSEKTLRDSFSRFGGLSYLRLDRSKVSHNVKEYLLITFQGTAYIGFSDPKSVNQALAQPNGTLELGGTRVTIHERRRPNRNVSQSGVGIPRKYNSGYNSGTRSRE